MHGQALRSLLVTSFIDVLTRSWAWQITNDSLHHLMQFVRNSDFKPGSYRAILGNTGSSLECMGKPYVRCWWRHLLTYWRDLGIENSQIIRCIIWCNLCAIPTSTDEAIEQSLGTQAPAWNAWASPTFAAGDVIYWRIDEILGLTNHKRLAASCDAICTQIRIQTTKLSSLKPLFPLKMHGQALRSLLVTSFIDILTRYCAWGIANDLLHRLMQYVRRCDFKRRR